MTNAHKLTMAFAMMAFMAFSIQPAQGQGFLDKLIDKTADKTTEKVTEGVSESASDKAAEESSEAVDSWLDGLFGGSQQSSGSSSGASQSSGSSSSSSSMPSGGSAGQSGMTEEQMAMMQQMMGNMDKSAEVPAEYTFDMVMHVEIRQTGEDPQQLELLVDKDGDRFGVAMQEEGTDRHQTSVIDSENGLMAVFTEEEDGSKTAMAIPNMMEMAGQYGQAQMEQAGQDYEAYGFKATGRTKTVAGYKCSEYKGEDEDTEATFYMTRELPADWMDAFMSGFGANAPAAFFQGYGDLQGTLMESHTVDKKSGDTTSWVTTKISTSGTTIRKSDYTFQAMGR